MSEPSAVFPCRFAFSYTDHELKAYSRLVGARQDRGPDTHAFFAATLGLIIGLGLLVVFARQQGLIAPSAVEPVLISTYGAFIFGAAAYAFTIHLGYRRIARRYRAYERDHSCELTFDVDGICCIDRRYEVRARWASVADMRETELLIVLWVGFRQGFVVPTRLFADAAARAAFVAAVRERITAAKADRSGNEDPRRWTTSRLEGQRSED